MLQSKAKLLVRNVPPVVWQWRVRTQTAFGFTELHRSKASSPGTRFHYAIASMGVKQALSVAAAAALLASGCGSSGQEPSVHDLVPVQGFRLKIGLDGSTRIGRDEARHQLYFRTLDEVIDRLPVGDGSPEEDLAFELLSSDGTVLESHPVYSWGLCVDPGGCFTEWEAVFEQPPDYDAFRFVDGSRVVYQRQRSPNAPEVSFLGLEQGQVFAGDVDLVFQLLIDDKDDDDLRPRTLFSVDGGPYESTYRAFTYSDLLNPLTVEDYSSPITMKSGVNVPGVARMVPAGSESVRLLVVVSDGSRVAAAQSPAFALEPIVAVLPRLQIDDMWEGEVIGPRGQFYIRARVRHPVLFGDELVDVDSSHPQVGDEQTVRWTSDIDGDITEHITPTGGRGRIETDALTPGTHELTATFTADSGSQTSDAITVTVLGPDDPIAAIDDHVPVAVGETVEHPVTANDVETSRRIDIDTLRIVAPPELGTASVLDLSLDQTGRAGAARVIQYTPHDLDIDYEDRLEDSVTYQICDKGPDPQCSTAELRMTVFPSGYPYWAYGW